MANRLATVLNQNRRQILALDRATLARTYAAYRDAMDRLSPLIELVQQQVKAQDGEITMGQLLRLERYRELQRQLDAEMTRLGQITGQITADAQRQAASLATDHAANAATASALRAADRAIVSSTWVRVPVFAMEDLVGALAEGPLKELIDGFDTEAAKIVTKRLTDGLALGQSPRTVADSIANATDIARNRALTIARTEMLRSYRSAASANYQQNADILKGWVWTAALSDRTCAACLAMDGTEHQLSESMDTHVNCRCSQRPLLKDVPSQSVQTGAEWFATQSQEVQDATLGKSGGAGYRSGVLRLDDFVKIDHSADWGDSIRDGGVAHAYANAAQRRQWAA